MKINDLYETGFISKETDFKPVGKLNRSSWEDTLEIVSKMLDVKVDELEFALQRNVSKDVYKDFPSEHDKLVKDETTKTWYTLSRDKNSVKVTVASGKWFSDVFDTFFRKASSPKDESYKTW